VYGGGGIHPDLVLAPDTLSSDEQLFLQQVQKHLQEYINARLAFAVSYLRQHPDLSVGFPVTDDLLDSYYPAITNAGVEVDRDLFDRAARWVGSDVAYEITYSKWGEQFARQRTNSDDPQVIAAANLLRRASTPESLFTLANSPDAVRSAAREPELMQTPR